MSGRMAGLDRAIRLIHLLCDRPDGFTLDEMAADSTLVAVRSSAGGLRELAEHLFTWGADIRIEGPEELSAVMRERLELALAAL